MWIATTLEPFIQGILPCSGFIRHVNRREPATTYGDHVVEVLYDFEAGLLDSTDRDGILRGMPNGRNETSDGWPILGPRSWVADIRTFLDIRSTYVLARADIRRTNYHRVAVEVVQGPNTGIESAKPCVNPGAFH